MNKPSQSDSMIIKLAHYVEWSIQKLVEKLKCLDEEAFTQNLQYFVNDTNFTASSVRSIVEHMIIGLEFCTAVSNETDFNGDQIIERYRTMDKNALLYHWIEVMDHFLEVFLQQLNKIVSFKGKELQLSEDFYFSFLNHVTYHKGQLNIAFKIVGEESGEVASYTDFIKEYK